MAKVQIKSEQITPFGGTFSIMEQFDALLSKEIDSTSGKRCPPSHVSSFLSSKTQDVQCRHYIRANRCSVFYEDMFILRGWRTEEINGIEFELNSMVVEKWEGKVYRLVVQRQRRNDNTQEIWEGEYTYRCILTNDFKSDIRDIVEFYNLRGGKERIFSGCYSVLPQVASCGKGGCA